MCIIGVTEHYIQFPFRYWLCIDPCDSKVRDGGQNSQLFCAKMQYFVQLELQQSEIEIFESIQIILSILQL